MIVDPAPTGGVVAIDWGRVTQTLPRPAWRRDWLGQYIVEAGALLKFPPLFAKLDPAAYRRLRPSTPRACYKAVLKWCSQRFPIADFWEDEDDPEFASWTHDHIPLELLGVDMWNGECGSPALELAFLAFPTNRGDLGNMDLEALDEYLDLLPKALVEGPLPGELAWGNLPKAPRRRGWKPPWDGLQDLFAYANNNTGFGILDCYDDGFDVYSLPRWNVEEVRNCVAIWERAKVVHHRAWKLALYVDERPRERLPLLAGALTGDRGTLQQLTQWKRGYGKTLADVLVDRPPAAEHRPRIRIGAR